MKISATLITLISVFLPLKAAAQGIPPLVQIERTQTVFSVVLRNVGATAMTAYVLTYSQAGQGGAQRTVWSRNIFDAVTNPSNQSIATGGVSTFKLGVKEGTADPIVQVRAGLYADGSSFGDIAWVDLIKSRRSAFLESSVNALADLSAARSGSQSLPDLSATMEAALSRRLSALNSEFQRAQNDVSRVSTGQPSPFDGGTPAETSAKLALLSTQDRTNATRAVYSAVINNLKAPPLLNGSPTGLAATLEILSAKLSEDVSRMSRK